MNEELSILTLGYLIGYYKTHEETIINKDEIDAINFLLDKNQELKQQLEQRDNIINKAREFIKNHNERAGKLYYKYDNKYLLSEIKDDLLKILNIDKGE